MDIKQVVNSHNEWDKLEEVIVGDGFADTLPAIDFSFRYFFHDNIYGRPTNWSEAGHQYITKRHVQEHHEDLQNFATLLESNNIKVRRPKVPDKKKTTETLEWKSTNYPALNVRDLSIIIGNEIIETPPACRWRYFENDYLKHLFLEYWKAGAKWTQAPKPIITDNSFDLNRFMYDEEIKRYYEEVKGDYISDLDLGTEIMFDAANCMRLGRDIIFNSSCENDRLGARWLQEQIGDEYRVHIVSVADSHIDSTFIPIRPGLALTTMKDLKQHMPDFMSNWDYIYVPIVERSQAEYQKQQVKVASPKIWINALSIDPGTIICHTEYYKFLKDKLQPYKVDVIPSQIRHCELFGGAHHCVTLDVRRDSVLEDYTN